MERRRATPHEITKFYLRAMQRASDPNFCLAREGHEEFFKVVDEYADEAKVYIDPIHEMSIVARLMPEDSDSLQKFFIRFAIESRYLQLSERIKQEPQTS